MLLCPRCWKDHAAAGKANGWAVGLSNTEYSCGVTLGYVPAVLPRANRIITELVSKYPERQPGTWG